MDEAKKSKKKQKEITEDRLKGLKERHSKEVTDDMLSLSIKNDY